jgi:hypothetical protein
MTNPTNIHALDSALDDLYTCAKRLARFTVAYQQARIARPDERPSTEIANMAQEQERMNQLALFIAEMTMPRAG